MHRFSSVWFIWLAKSGLETVIEHLVVRQGQARGAQVYAVHMNDQYGY